MSFYVESEQAIAFRERCRKHGVPQGDILSKLFALALSDRGVALFERTAAELNVGEREAKRAEMLATTPTLPKSARLVQAVLTVEWQTTEDIMRRTFQGAGVAWRCLRLLVTAGMAETDRPGLVEPIAKTWRPPGIRWRLPSPKPASAQAPR